MTRRVALILVAIVLAAAAATLFTGPGQSVLAWAGNLWRPAETDAPEPVHTVGHGGAPMTNAPEMIPRAEISLDTRRQQLAGVRTTPVVRAMVTSEIRATGTVRADETRQTDINTRVDGWVRDLRADYTGKAVSRGEVLFTLYSPELIATQNEFLLAVRGYARTPAESAETREFSNRLIEAARQRLLLWGMTPGDIAELEQRRQAFETVPFRSPVTGVVVEKRAVEGMRVMAGEMLLRVADLSSVWIEADVYERDMALVRVGQSARVSLDSYPGEPFVGRVTYVYPLVEENTRTVRVRFQFPNRGGRLKPGMFAAVELTAPAGAAVTVPIDAVLEAGADQVVFVAKGDGYFEPRRVRIGRRTGDVVEVVSGLQEGEEVATGATFFLDSESQLRAAAQNFQEAPAASDPSTPREALDITLRPQPDPPRTGDNMFEVTVKDASGQPIADGEVTVTFFMAAMPSMNMPAMRNDVRLLPVGGGVYRGSGQVMIAGRWDVTVTVSRGGQRLGSRQFAIVAR